MRLARAFSTSLRHTKQALYEPYVPQMSQEHQKMLRKIVNAKHPKLHPKISRDVERMLRAYSVRQPTLEKRMNTIRQIKELVQSAFGPGYSVVDLSMSQYCTDFDYAPLELAITDTNRPSGIPPEEIGSQIPDAYNHEAIARLLQGHGYSGCFIDGDAMRNQPPTDPEGPSDLELAEKRGPFPITHPWPTYTPYPTFHLTYPPVLWVEPDPTDTETMPFYLSPPVAVHMPLLRLLKAYTALSISISHLITFAFMWTRSLNLPEFTPKCVALMVLGFLQHEKYIPNLQMSEDPNIIKNLAEQNDGVWFTSARLSRGALNRMFSSTWLETGVYPSKFSIRYPKKISGLIYDFFDFWKLYTSESAFINTYHYLSLREGGFIPRQQKMVNYRKAILQDDQEISRGRAPLPSDQPTMWKSQPIVVQDPFVPSYNHARALSKTASDYFQYFCSLSLRTISSRNPMVKIIGPHLGPPRSSGSSPRNYSTGSLSQEITSMYEASIPPQPIIDSRNMTISRVQFAINKRFGRGYTVECFGSTRYGVSTPTSDLDLVVIDSRYINGFRTHVKQKRLPDVYNVWTVSRLLVNNGFTNVLAIPKAKVPIVKFRDPRSNLDCDLNINEQLGLFNTRLTAQYCELIPDLLRPLLVVIKRWAKSHNLNDPSGSSGPISFSSYALVLMTIGYLQIKGVLPNLQAGLEPLPPDAKRGLFWLRSPTGGGTPCDIRFNSGNDWKPPVHLSVEEALLGWFTFWAEYKYDEHILSIKEGRLVSRRSNIRSQKRKKQKQKKQKIEDTMSNAEIQELMAEEAEEAALEAFAEQNESDESEDESDISEEQSDQTEEQNDILADQDNVLADQDDILEVLNGLTQEYGERADGEQILTMNTLSPEKQMIGAPTKEGVSQEDTDGGAAEPDVLQPPIWAKNTLVLVDPFLVAKNVCGAIGKKPVNRFREECRRSVKLIEWGTNLEDLMGEHEFSPPERPSRGRGNRKNKGRGRGGRG